MQVEDPSQFNVGDWVRVYANDATQECECRAALRWGSPQATALHVGRRCLALHVWRTAGCGFTAGTASPRPFRAAARRRSLLEQQHARRLQAKRRRGSGFDIQEADAAPAPAPAADAPTPAPMADTLAPAPKPARAGAQQAGDLPPETDENTPNIDLNIITAPDSVQASCAHGGWDGSAERAKEGVACTAANSLPTTPGPRLPRLSDPVVPQTAAAV